MYDGFYAVVTNLEDNPAEIIKINKQRWEIEESFRIMKSDFEARPVYVQRDDRIKAHFLTCYINLLVYRLLEKKLGERFTCTQILETLRGMNMTLLGKDSGYIPSYKRTKLTDALHKNIVHIDANEQTATEPINTGFAAVLSFINCQRWECTTKSLGNQKISTSYPGLFCAGWN